MKISAISWREIGEEMATGRGSKSFICWRIEKRKALSEKHGANA
jgi:hypothetical protein